MSQQERSYHDYKGYMIYPKWRTESEGQNPETYIIYRSAYASETEAEEGEPAPDDSFLCSRVVEESRYDTMNEAKAFIDGLTHLDLHVM